MSKNPHKLLVSILAQIQGTDKWEGQPFEKIKRIPSSTVGEVGQRFVAKLCEQKGIKCTMPSSSQSPWDIQIEKTRFELKTATEDVNCAFQFNHIRYHREYDALLCIGISPSEIFVGAWSKEEVTTGKAGKLAAMEKGTNASHKLTKRGQQLTPILGFEELVRTVLSRTQR